ncbi:DNA-directed RNA polymerase II subunit RPB1-like [Amphibalanus amphitrite]|uniref:DNA-directed RNA polymerase II subunit RPB1-like n=1 Tax=Amphibalanus amphitrite TaxID=1232801 RepID=UPI001C90E2E4|nr:DNA-directed RNA polymerase II subunit RPB1-like [Amphibalanus amphitrite]
MKASVLSPFGAMALPCLLAALLVARPAAGQLHGRSPPWSVPWAARPAAVPPPPSGAGLPVPLATIEPLGPFGPSARSVSEGRDGAGSASAAQQGGFTQTSGHRDTAPFSSSQQSFSPSHQSFSPSHQSFSPSHQSFSPGSQSFSPGSQSFSPGSQSFSPGSQSFSPAPQPFSPTHQSFSQSSFSPVPSFVQNPPHIVSGSSGSFPNPSSFIISSQSVSRPSSPFSPPPQGGVSGFGPSRDKGVHSTQQYEECPYGMVCVDEYLCPPYGRVVSKSAAPRDFSSFNQPHNDIQPGADSSLGHAASHDSGHHGGGCGYNSVCCKKEFVPPHHLHGRPGHCLGPHCPPPHAGPYPSAHGGYGGHHGGYGSHGYGGYGTHAQYQPYPAYATGYGQSGYYPSYPQGYGGGYSAYTPYLPSYSSYPTYPSYPSYPSYPQIPSYPGALPSPAAHGFADPFSSQSHAAQTDSKGSPTSEGDGAGQRSAPSSRTVRMFL